LLYIQLYILRNDDRIRDKTASNRKVASLAFEGEAGDQYPDTSMDVENIELDVLVGFGEVNDSNNANDASSNEIRHLMTIMMSRRCNQ
jgi:hypothetical protein